MADNKKTIDVLSPDSGVAYGWCWEDNLNTIYLGEPHLETAGQVYIDFGSGLQQSDIKWYPTKD